MHANAIAGVSRVLGVVLPARWGWGWVNTLPGKRVETFKKETFKRSFQKVILS